MADITLETEGAVATVTIDAPPVNAFTIARYERLTEIFTEIGGRDDIHCVILTARGNRAFCAGLDLDEFLAAPPEDDGIRQRIGRETFTAMRRCPVPIIAAINGPALGAGCVFAAISDIRIASERATFGLPEINVGRCGGAAYVGRFVPQGTLRLMFFTGEALSAHEAHRTGLVDRVVSPRHLLPVAQDIARTIASKSPLGIRIGKRALDETEFLPADEGYVLEQKYSTELVQTHDSREALRAVVEKRAPTFLGR